MQKINLPFLLGFVLTISLLWPLTVAPFFSHHDDVQVIRLHQMDKCIKDGQIPCRWVPDLGGEYGYPLFNYYAPLPYYYGEIIYLLSNNLIFSVKVMFATSFIGAYVFMFLLGKKLWGSLGGSLSAIFYSFAPYHALDFYIRGAMGEVWAMIFIPAIIWALLTLFDKPRIKNALILAILTAFLPLSHNLSAFIFAPVFLILVVVLLIQVKNLKFLKLVCLSLIISFLISSFYTLPAVLEKDLVHVDTTTFGYFSYTEHFKGLRKTILDRSWAYGSSVREVPGGERDILSYQVGWIHILGLIISLYVAFKLYNNQRLISKIIFLMVSVFVVSIFMIHPKSEFIWRLIDGLKYLQFPWRFLILSIFTTSLLSGSVIYFLEKSSSQLKIGLWIILILLVSLNFSYFKPEKFLYVEDANLLTGEHWDRQIKRSIFDYLPKSAHAPPAQLAPSPYQILTGEVEIKNFQKGSNWIKFEADAKSHSIIRLSQYYFPNWKIFNYGDQIKFDYNNDLGLMTLILGAGKYQIEARLFDTNLRNISNISTLSGIGFFLIILILQIPAAKKWLLYYFKEFNR